MKWLREWWINWVLDRQIIIDAAEDKRTKLAEALVLLEKQQEIIDSLNEGYSLLCSDRNKRIEDMQQTVACMVSMMGNNVVIGLDLIKAMRQADLFINYKATDDGVLISLLNEEEAMALQKEIAE